MGAINSLLFKVSVLNEPSASTISSAEANKSFRIALSDGIKSAYFISGIIFGNTD